MMKRWIGAVLPFFLKSNPVVQFHTSSSFSLLRSRSTLIITSPSYTSSLFLSNSPSLQPPSNLRTKLQFPSFNEFIKNVQQSYNESAKELIIFNQNNTLNINPFRKFNRFINSPAILPSIQWPGGNPILPPQEEDFLNKEYQADSTLRKRKLKMRRHKARKRRRLLRKQTRLNK